MATTSSLVVENRVYAVQGVQHKIGDLRVFLQKTACARRMPRRVKHPDRCRAQFDRLIVGKQSVRHGVHR